MEKQSVESKNKAIVELEHEKTIKLLNRAIVANRIEYYYSEFVIGLLLITSFACIGWLVSLFISKNASNLMEHVTVILGLVSIVLSNTEDLVNRQLEKQGDKANAQFKYAQELRNAYLNDDNLQKVQKP